MPNDGCASPRRLADCHAPKQAREQNRPLVAGVARYSAPHWSQTAVNALGRCVGMFPMFAVLAQASEQYLRGHDFR